MGALKKLVPHPHHCDKCVPTKKPTTQGNSATDKATINSMTEQIQKKLKEDPELIKKAAQILTELINK